MYSHRHGQAFHAPRFKLQARDSPDGDGQHQQFRRRREAAEDREGVGQVTSDMKRSAKN